MILVGTCETKNIQHTDGSHYHMGYGGGATGWCHKLQRWIVEFQVDRCEATRKTHWVSRAGPVGVLILDLAKDIFFSLIQDGQQRTPRVQSFCLKAERRSLDPPFFMSLVHQQILGVPWVSTKPTPPIYTPTRICWCQLRVLEKSAAENARNINPQYLSNYASSSAESKVSTCYQFVIWTGDISISTS